jgi:hypothetical protein
VSKEVLAAVLTAVRAQVRRRHGPGLTLRINIRDIFAPPGCGYKERFQEATVTAGVGNLLLEKSPEQSVFTSLRYFGRLPLGSVPFAAVPLILPERNRPSDDSTPTRKPCGTNPRYVFLMPGLRWVCILRRGAQACVRTGHPAAFAPSQPVGAGAGAGTVSGAVRATVQSTGQGSGIPDDGLLLRPR